MTQPEPRCPHPFCSACYPLHPCRPDCTICHPSPPSRPEPDLSLPSRCDYCWRRNVIVLDVACVHEHIGAVIVCRDKHEARVRDEKGDVACTQCFSNAGEWVILYVIGESTLLPEPRPDRTGARA